MKRIAGTHAVPLCTRQRKCECAKTLDFLSVVSHFHSATLLGVHAYGNQGWLRAFLLKEGLR
jgi:hypothetical protein